MQPGASGTIGFGAPAAVSLCLSFSTLIRSEATHFSYFVSDTWLTVSNSFPFLLQKSEAHKGVRYLYHLLLHRVRHFRNRRSDLRSNKPQPSGATPRGQPSSPRIACPLCISQVWRSPASMSRVWARIAGLGVVKRDSGSTETLLTTLGRAYTCG